MTVDELIGDYSAFLKTLSQGLDKLGVDRGEIAMMDHVCYRVESEERYQELLLNLRDVAVLLGENKIGGRLIATFELNEYLRADGWIVPYVELPAPKEGSPYTEGLEHVELVVIGGLDRFLKRHNDLHFSLKGMSKTVNPEASLKQDGISIKFHEQPLGAVVRIEKRLALVES
jgi:predicted metalloenzyme YecM